MSPLGDCGGVQINEETTERCRRCEGMLRWKDRIWETRNVCITLFGWRCMRVGIPVWKLLNGSHDGCSDISTIHVMSSVVTILASLNSNITPRQFSHSLSTSILAIFRHAIKQSAVLKNHSISSNHIVRACIIAFSNVQFLGMAVCTVCRDPLSSPGKFQEEF